MPFLRPSLYFLVLAGLYWHSAAPQLYWGDDGELLTAAALLDIAHPPGHPLTALAFRAAFFLPFGNLAFRAHLLNGALLALGALFVYLLVAAWGRELKVNAWCANTGSLLAMAGYGLFPGNWLQVVRAETYALHTFLGALVAYWCLRPKPRPFPAAFAWGLSLTNHSLTAAMLAPLFLRPFGIRFFSKTGFSGHSLSESRTPFLLLTAWLLGLSALLYLPLRAGPGIVTDGDDPATLGRFFSLLTAQRYQGQLYGSEAGLIELVARNTWEVLQPYVRFWSVGLLLLLPWGWRRLVGPRLLLGVVGAVNILLVASSGFYHPQNMDFLGYLVPMNLAVAVVAGWSATMAGEGLLKRFPRTMAWRHLAEMVIVILIVQRGFTGFSEVSKREVRLGYLAPRMQLDALPQGSVILTASDLRYPMEFLIEEERRRPDVAIVSRSRLSDSAAIRQYQRRFPQVDWTGFVPTAEGYREFFSHNHQYPLFWEAGEDFRILGVENWALVGFLRRVPGQETPLVPRRDVVIEMVRGRLKEEPAERLDWNGAEWLGMAFYNRGIWETRRVEWKAAEKEFLQATALNPNDVRFWQNLGATQAQQEQWQEALASFQKALTLNPQHPTTYLNLLQLAIETGRQELYEHTLQEAKQRFPHDMRFTPPIIQKK